MSRINTNVSSLVAQNRLQTSNKDLQTALTRLSTGLRINTGSDDPAGLIASEALRSEITSLNKSISNTRRASQIISTADSALGQVSNLLNDIRGLVVEAANSGALSPDEIAANQLQVDSSLEAINRIAQTTTFQGRKLLDGSLDFITTSGSNTSRIQDLRINNASLGSTGKVDVAINVREAATQAAMEIGGFIEEGTPTIEGTAASGSLTITQPGQAASAEIEFGAGADTTTLTITNDTIGAAGNDLTVTFVKADLSGSGNTPTATVDGDGNITVTITDQADTAISDIADAINDLEGYTVTTAEEGNGAADFAAAAAAPGQLTFSGGIDASDSVTIDITADGVGAAFNGEIVLVQDENATTPTAAFEDGVLTVTINSSGSIDVADIVAAIDGLNDFSASTDSTVESINADEPVGSTSVDLAGGTDDQFGAIAATGGLNFEVETAAAAAAGSLEIAIETAAAVQATSGAITVPVAGQFTLTANANGAYADDALNGFDINVVTTAADGGTASSIDVSGNTITVTLEEGQTLSQIATFLASNDDFVFASTATDAVDNTSVGTGTMGGGSAAEFETVTIDITAADNGAAFNGTVEFVQANGVASPTAAFADGVLTITVDDTNSIEIADIVSAIADLEEFSASATGDLTSFNGNDASLAVTENDLAGGVDFGLQEGGITITATTAGAEFNGEVVYRQVAGTETPTATYEDGTLTVTVDTTGTVSLASIAEAISALDEFSATTSGTVTEFTADDGTLTVTANDLAGGIDDLTVGVQANAVFELSGMRGSEVFNVSAGTTLDQLVDQINLVTDATGIQASLDGTNLLLTSTDFGSEARVELRVLSQDEGGNFGEGGRTVGTDIVATVNGRMANGVGNRLSVNTATLNMSADMEGGYEGEATFTIVGGGANFQLGPEVVGNQQARIGIGSVNAARLGGVSGKLYELGSGESAALASDPTRAARIVNEAIAQVAGLRGRLGAFQSTSLESNLVSLSDTVANLQEAESSIRDADFAAESAALTRAQILVQSGTNVLSLANQNPQNVLALLR